MNRRFESKEKIENLIVAEKAKYADCVNTRLLEIYWHEPDETGCNWSATYSNSHDLDSCLSRIGPFIAQLRASINLDQ
jgi:hypothetical protein